MAPELRVVRRLGAHSELNVGAELLMMMALAQPRWNDDSRVVAEPRGSSEYGVGKFASEPLLGSFVLVVVPGIGARDQF